MLMGPLLPLLESAATALRDPATALAVGLGGFLFLCLLWCHLLYNSSRSSPLPPKELEIKSLTIYPIKSCAAVSLQECMVDRHGLRGDRDYAVCIAVADLPMGDDQFEISRGNTKIDSSRGNSTFLQAPYQVLSARELPTLMLLQPALKNGGVVFVDVIWSSRRALRSRCGTGTSTRNGGGSAPAGTAAAAGGREGGTLLRVGNGR